MMSFDALAQKYIQDRGWKINEDGLLQITAKQVRKEQYIGRSIHDPSQRTLMIPTLHGCTLLFEGKHFIVVN